VTERYLVRSNDPEVLITVAREGKDWMAAHAMKR
jgi:hypothetical protein